MVLFVFLVFWKKSTQMLLIKKDKMVVFVIQFFVTHAFFLRCDNSLFSLFLMYIMILLINAEWISRLWSPKEASLQLADHAGNLINIANVIRSSDLMT